MSGKNPKQDAVMITSIVNGCQRYHVHEQSKAEKLRAFERAQLLKLGHKMIHQEASMDTALCY